MNSQLRINFNVTMLDMSCDYATVDLYDVVGTNSMNVRARAGVRAGLEQG